MIHDHALIHYEKKTSAYTNMYIYCIIKSVASYMFRPPIVAIFRNVFLEGYMT